MMVSFAELCGPAPFDVITSKHDVILAAKNGALFPGHSRVFGAKSPVLREELAGLLERSDHIPGCNGLPIWRSDLDRDVLHDLALTCMGEVSTRLSAGNTKKRLLFLDALLKFKMMDFEDTFAVDELRACAVLDPIEAYVLAISNRWEEGARISTLESARLPLPVVARLLPRASLYNEDVALREGGRIYDARLELVRVCMCPLGIDDPISLLWLDEKDYAFFNCPHTRKDVKEKIPIDNYNDSVMAPKWFIEYCLALREAIWKCSLPATISNFRIPKLKNPYCQLCKARIQGDLNRFLSRMAAIAKEGLAEVDIDTYFPEDMEALIAENERERAAAATSAVILQPQTVLRNSRVRS
ncbi:hypothetical protein PsYK624_171780 [Phanerochaete sordida]|uniref:BTB domain-containing protein n=1 Tax=Phanerochaete sordida TaxID=48140 RepID=A0A9P3GZ09_9APHY|nr:hypothetical protein PsYK624_171780 [Phanerochaete sordida]